MSDISDFDDWLCRLKQCKKLVVVEGKKDKQALSNLGIHNVKTLSHALYKEVEMIASKNTEVVLLTDLDKAGKKIYGRLKKDLNRNGVKVDNKFREFLLRTHLVHIEGICTYINNH